MDAPNKIRRPPSSISFSSAFTYPPRQGEGTGEPGALPPIPSVLTAPQTTMSAFQDFGPLTERRRAERQQRRRKHLMIAGASMSVLLIVAVVGAAAVLYHPNGAHTSTTSNGSTTSSTATSKEMNPTSKAIITLCSSTDYKQTCEKTLANASNAHADPKSLLHAAVSAVETGIATAFDHAANLKSTDPKVKGAVDYCKQLLNDSKNELIKTLDGINAHNLADIPKKGYLLRNWLSAVMTYQENCIDAFPDGDLKNKMEAAMNSSKEVTSNALAIIGKASTFFKALDIPGFNRRRLLAAFHEFDQEPAFHEDGFPWWVSEHDRRHLKERAADRLKANVIVAKDGSGNFTTISDALAALPTKYDGRFIIYVKAGEYDEHVEITKKMVNLTIYGDGSQKSMVTGNRNVVDGWRTFETATFAVEADGFICEGMGFRNTAGAEKHQAVALRVNGDRAIFVNSRMEGYQDTLYTQSHFQFYRSCVISGTVDYIFGDAHVILQNCVLSSRRPMDNQQNIITAQGRIDRNQPSGTVIHNCRIIADPALAADKAKIRSYLGRPWKAYSRTIIMETEIEDFISPDGYMPWNGQQFLDTLYYAEYNNRGPGSDVKGRVKWKGVEVLKKTDADQYTVSSFLHGDDWLKPSGTPVRMGLYQ